MERFEHVSDAGSIVRAGDVAQRLQDVRKRIERACAAAGRAAGSVSVLAVTKGFGPEAIQAALAAGLRDIGENYLQEAQAKFATVAWAGSPARRHFIGRIQRNKARRIAEAFNVVQSVVEEAVAAKLDEGARHAGKVLDVLVQVNAAGDDRTGIPVEDASAFARALRAFPALRVRGAMAVGPVDAARTGAAFERAAQAFRDLQRECGADMFSLGMSGDLEAAVAAGSTMVRIGTALFGTRPAKVVR